jgi:hypothetical protein
MLALVALGAVGALLGLLHPPSAGTPGEGEQALDVVRAVTTVALAVALLFGPGIAWRALSLPERPGSLAFLFLPGFALLALVGGLAWALAGEIAPPDLCFAIFLPVLAWLAGVLLWAGPHQLLSSEERRCLLVVGCVLGLAVGRALWSLGPEGELYGGTVSRTLEVGDRSDARISYIIPQLVAHGADPYGPMGASFFAPYNFSSRGPLPGLASSPIVFLSGGSPPAELPEQPWRPFDPQGFMAYRLAMLAFASTAFVALWDLTRRVAGSRAAMFALLLAATTPFLVHEVWFTWPKMPAASFVLLAAICVISRRPFAAGALAGLGYLMHPVALLSLPALGLLALWPLVGARWKRPRIGQAALLAAGLAGFLIAWRLLNGEHFEQEGFVNYFKQAGWEFHPNLAEWGEYRLKSLANTVVPLLLPFSSETNPSINVPGGLSPDVIHFFFMYWNTVPFGVAIVFFPLLLISLWRAARRWPWPFTATVAIPFLLFVVYWGASSTGLMREGLQPWALTLFVVIGCEQAASGFGWLRSLPIRALLTLRVVEVLAMALVPTLATRHELFGNSFVLSDAIALLAILGFAAALAWLVWSQEPPARRGEQPVHR